MSTNIKYDSWDEGVLLSTVWVEVWSTPTLKTPGRFHESVWQVDSSKIDVRITVNGLVVFEHNLNVLSSGMGLTFSSDIHTFSVREYAPNKWVVRPPQAWQIDKDSGLAIEMRKSAGNDKELVRGMSVWGEP